MRKINLILFLFSCVTIINAQTDTTSQPPLEDFIGVYVFPDGSPVPEVDVTVASGTLNMSSVAGSSTCTRLGADSFNIDQFNGWAAFKRGDDKKVNAVHIEASGYVLDGQKKNDGSWIFSYYIKPDNTELLLAKK